jgi:membrane protease YdiL (CAAX protease family)
MNKEYSPKFNVRISTLIALGIFALALTVLTGGVWTVLLIANLATSPAVPWAVIVMAILLWLMWQYLDGKGWPDSTSEARHRYLRARLVSRPVFTWSLAAGMFSIIALTGLWIVLFQLVKVPGNALPDFSKYPFLLVTLVLFMASLAASVAEEACFRGYFQSALEARFSGFTAILITILVISPGHSFTQGFVWPTMMFYFFVDAVFGTLAYLCNSILPGIVIHTIGLFIFFAAIWPFDASRRLISEGGADVWFWLHIVQMVIFAILAFLAFRQLARITNLHRHKT